MRRSRWPLPPADLLIVGASVRAAAQSAARAGLQVIAADHFADQDLVAAFPTLPIDDYGALANRLDLEAIAREWMYTGALENRPDVIRSLSRQLPLAGNDARTVQAVRDPWRLAACLARHGLAHPEVRESLPEGGAAGGRFGWLLKNLASSGGAGVRWAGQHAYVRRSGRYFQRFIRGASQSAVFVAAPPHCRLLILTEQLVGCAWTGADPFRYCGSLGPLPLTGDQAGRWERIGRELTRDFGLTGLFGVDAVVDERGVWPVEVNPRYTASMELLDRAHGVSAVGIHCRACGWGDVPGPLPAAHGMWGKAVLYARCDFRVPWQLAHLPREGDRLLGGAVLADVPAPGSWIAAGRPILTLLVHQPNRRAVLDHLRWGAREIFRICLSCATWSE